MSYESDHNSTASKHNEGQIPGGKENIENYQYNIRYSVPFKYARHFARGIQNCRCATHEFLSKAVKLVVADRFFYAFFWTPSLILLFTAGETKI